MQPKLQLKFATIRRGVDKPSRWSVFAEKASVAIGIGVVPLMPDTAMMPVCQ
jgi:hypothetical protein